MKKTKRVYRECISCSKRAAIDGSKYCDHSCRYDVCIECFISFGQVSGNGSSLNNYFTKCFICREKLNIGNKIKSILNTRNSFVSKVKHEDQEQYFLIFKNSQDQSVGIAEVLEDISIDNKTNTYFVSREEETVLLALLELGHRQLTAMSNSFNTN